MVKLRFPLTALAAALLALFTGTSCTQSGSEMHASFAGNPTCEGGSCPLVIGGSGLGSTTCESCGGKEEAFASIFTCGCEGAVLIEDPGSGETLLLATPGFQDAFDAGDGSGGCELVEHPGPYLSAITLTSSADAVSTSIETVSPTKIVSGRWHAVTRSVAVGIGSIGKCGRGIQRGWRWIKSLFGAADNVDEAVDVARAGAKAHDLVDNTEMLADIAKAVRAKRAANITNLMDQIAAVKNRASSVKIQQYPTVVHDDIAGWIPKRVKCKPELADAYQGASQKLRRVYEIEKELAEESANLEKLRNELSGLIRDLELFMETLCDGAIPGS